MNSVFKERRNSLRNVYKEVTVFGQTIRVQKKFKFTKLVNGLIYVGINKDEINFNTQVFSTENVPTVKFIGTGIEYPTVNTIKNSFVGFSEFIPDKRFLVAEKNKSLTFDCYGQTLSVFDNTTHITARADKDSLAGVLIGHTVDNTSYTIGVVCFGLVHPEDVLIMFSTE